jgi:hypothetical protein
MKQFSSSAHAGFSGPGRTMASIIRRLTTEEGQQPVIAPGLLLAQSSRLIPRRPLGLPLSAHSPITPRRAGSRGKAARPQNSELLALPGLRGRVTG